MPKSTRRASIFAGPLVAIVDFYALLSQQNMLQAEVERMRRPTYADMSLTPSEGQGQTKEDVALVTISVDADGSIHLDDQPEPVTLATLATRLTPYAEKPGTAYLYGSDQADWGLILAVQRGMQASLKRNVVTPLLKEKQG